MYAQGDTKLVVYHSSQWSVLVETGWITKETFPSSWGDQITMAKMLYHPNDGQRHVQLPR